MVIWYYGTVFLCIWYGTGTMVIWWTYDANIMKYDGNRDWWLALHHEVNRWLLDSLLDATYEIGISWFIKCMNIIAISIINHGFWSCKPSFAICGARIVGIWCELSILLRLTVIPWMYPPWLYNGIEWEYHGEYIEIIMEYESDILAHSQYNWINW